MFRLIALAWNGGDLHQCGVAQRLVTAVEVKHPVFRCVFSDEGLRVYFVSDALSVARVYPMGQGAGVVLGSLFQRDSDGGACAGEPVLDDAVTSVILRTSGQALCERFWGRYVALMRDSSDRSVFVLPDPTGECPLYSTSVDGVAMLFSHLMDVTVLNVQRFSVNWRFIAASMLEPELHSIETGITEVGRMRAGEVLRILADGTQQRTFIWDLFQLAMSSPVEDFVHAAKLARHVIGTCVERWASRYPSIVLLLSGGIDSSILLAALLRAQGSSQVTCLHLYDHNIGGDERRFAQIAAEMIQSPDARRSELIECERTVDGIDLKVLLHVPPSVRPRAYLAEALYRREYLRATVPRQAALATGFGGDYIFYNTSRARPAVDYVRRHGVGRELWRMVWDNTGSRTYWSVLWEALSIGLSKRDLAPPSLRSVDTFLSANIAGRAGDVDLYRSAPWRQSPALLSATAFPPGKRRHIETMYFPEQMHDAFEPGTGLQWFSPLLSQPIIELFARIPTYVLRHRGVGRSVARRAFASELPAQIRRRSWKSVTDNFVYQVLRKHEGFFRDLLLDGVLVKEGLLDPIKVEKYLREAGDAYAAGTALIVGEYFDLEIWLRSVQSSASAYKC